jgi:lipopolysaccharide/colanic/teichoic acid biosynthesis glycosyltransferase
MYRECTAIRTGIEAARMTARTELCKRALDLALSGLLLVVLAPLLVLIAVAIRAETPGPAFYRPRRIGRGGVPFEMLKFRSMVVSPQAGGDDPITRPGDARITRLGAWLRLFKLDELPQLLNVFRGDMSLVGPRAEDVRLVEELFTEEQKRVLTVRPGMTGLGQVRFFPDMTSEVPPDADPMTYYRDVQLKRKLDVDLEYVDRASIPLDLYLLARTAYCVLVKSWWILLNHPPRELTAKDSQA